jgi:hypothetical protein
MHAHAQVLVRKGGIREPTFTPKAQRFLLFPTAFHSDAQLLKPGIAEQFHEVGGCTFTHVLIHWEAAA